MPIDWNKKIIIVSDEDTVDAICGKEILYVRGGEGGGGGGGGDKADTSSLADIYDPLTTYPFGAFVAKNGKLYMVSPGFEKINYKILEASGHGYDGEYYYYDDPYDHYDGLYLMVIDNPQGLIWEQSSAMAAFNSLTQGNELQAVESEEYDPEETYEIGDIVTINGVYYKKVESGNHLSEITVEEMIDEKGADAPHDGKGYIKRDGEWVEETITKEITREGIGENFDNYRYLTYKNGDETDTHALWFRIYPQLVDAGIEKTYEPCDIEIFTEEPPSQARKKYYVYDSIDATTPISQITPLKENDLVMQYPPQWQVISGQRNFMPLNNYELICVPKAQTGNVNLLTPITIDSAATNYVKAQTDGSILLKKPSSVTSSLLRAVKYPVYLRAGSYKITGGVTRENSYTNQMEECVVVKVDDDPSGTVTYARDAGSGAEFTIPVDRMVFVHIDLYNLQDTNTFPYNESIYPMLLPANATTQNYLTPSGFCIKNNRTIWGGYIDFATHNRVREWSYVENYNLDTGHDPEITGKWYSDRDDYVPGTLPQDGATVVYQNNIAGQSKLDKTPKINNPNQYIFIFMIDVQYGEDQSKNINVVKRYGYKIPVKDYVDGKISDLLVNTLASQEMIADAYQPGYPYYEVGDVVIKDGKLCRRSISPFPSGFDEIETTEITAQGGARTGDYLTYNGVLYLFVYESANVVYWNLPTAQEAVEYLLSEGRIEEVQYSEYDEAGTYDIGDIVENDGEFYRKSADSYIFTEVTVDELLGEKIDDAPSDNKTYGRRNGQWREVTGGGGGGTPLWGDIEGTLSDQTDLQSALDAKADTSDLGALAYEDSVDYSDVTNTPTLGSLAAKNTADYATDVTNKPTLGSLADQDTVNYETEVTNKPTLGTMSAVNDAPSDGSEYVRKNGTWSVASGGGGGGGTWGSITGTLSNQTDLQTALNAKANTADLGNLAALDSIDYTGNLITNKPTLGSLAGKNTVDWDTDIDDIPSAFPPSAHTHDDRYYTETEVDGLLGTKQDTLTFDSAPTASSANPVTSGGVYTAIHGCALHISMASTSSLGTISNADITTTMRVVGIVWGTPANVTSNVTWNTNTAGQLVLSGTLAGATTAEIDLIDFG